jgi:serine/threonine protein phosphatase PrpC
VRDGLANQDAWASWTSSGSSPPTAVIAVADGHGGARHFRSAVGARLAVDVTVEVLRDAAPFIDTAPDGERTRVMVVDTPLRIVQTWARAARGHLAAHPISDDEWLSLEAADGASALDAVRDDPLLAYGATLLAALVTEQCVVLAQLGDGDILAVDADGSTTRPVPSDERLVGNLTTSICRADAHRDFRGVVMPIESQRPALLLLCTDGYANSFESDADFMKVGQDFLEMIRNEGISAIGTHLPSILEHATTHGSGDDITLGVLYRNADSLVDAVSPSTAQLRAPDDDAAARQRLHQPLNEAETRARSARRVWMIVVLVALAVIGWSMRDYLRALFA